MILPFALAIGMRVANEIVLDVDGRMSTKTTTSAVDSGGGDYDHDYDVYR